jgi:hypothetical protein
MSSVVKKDVLRFQITIDDLEAVQTLKRAKQFRGIETSTVDIKALFSLKVVEQLAAVNKCKH